MKLYNYMRLVQNDDKIRKMFPTLNTMLIGVWLATSSFLIFCTCKLK
jgi:hypothetical protein